MVLHPDRINGHVFGMVDVRIRADESNAKLFVFSIDRGEVSSGL